jgi:hypothetical protein
MYIKQILSVKHRTKEQISMPTKIGRYNDKHVNTCEEYPDKFFEPKEQQTKVKSLINTDSKINQE